MGFQIPCPVCGLRSVYEFKFGMEVKSPPETNADLKTWNTYHYFNRNICGVHEEWWYHGGGCGSWFKLKRDTSSNEIIED